MPVSQASSTPGDFGFLLRFGYAPVLTYSSTLRSGARQSLAKTPNLPGVLALRFWQ
jgi:hypothetical protein